MRIFISSVQCQSEQREESKPQQSQSKTYINTLKIKKTFTGIQEYKITTSDLGFECV